MGDGGGSGARRTETPMAFGAAVPEDYVAIRSIPSVSRCSIPRAARPFRRHRPPTHTLPAGPGLPSARPRPLPVSLSSLELRPDLTHEY